MNYIIGFLIQLIAYSLIWFWDEYLGLLLCLIMAFVLLGLLLLAYVVEFIEKSKVPKTYFTWMLISAIAPAVVAGFFSFIYQGKFDWLDQF